MNVFCCLLIGDLVFFGRFLMNVFILCERVVGIIFFLMILCRMFEYGFRIIWVIWMKLMVLMVEVYFDKVIVFLFDVFVMIIL